MNAVARLLNLGFLVSHSHWGSHEFDPEDVISNYNRNATCIDFHHGLEVGGGSRAVHAAMRRVSVHVSVVRGNAQWLVSPGLGDLRARRQ